MSDNAQADDSKAPARRWTKADVKRFARKVLGSRARVRSTPGRVYLELELPQPKGSDKAPGRIIITSAPDWGTLVEQAFIAPLRAAERAKEAGFDVKGIRQAVREAYAKPQVEGHEPPALPAGESAPE